MKILAIEASSEQASVALLIDGAIFSRRIDGATNHSQTVLRDVRNLLAEAGLPIGALDAVAFGAGPGAFTGLRLACGVAQGLALGADLGIAVVGSLDAIALQARAPRVLVATDARMGELYYAAFEGDQADSLQALGPVRCALPEALEIPPGPWLGAGSAFRVWPDVLRARLGDQLLDCRDALCARADEVALLAVRQVREQRLLAPALAAPLYVRDKVAFTTAERLARGGKA